MLGKTSRPSQFILAEAALLQEVTNVEGTYTFAWCNRYKGATNALQYRKSDPDHRHDVAPIAQAAKTNNNTAENSFQ